MCEDNSCQLKLNSFSMLYGFNATCFGWYTRCHYQADKTLIKHYDVICIMLFNIIHICSWDLNFTNIIKGRICWKQSGHTHYLLLWPLLLLHQYIASLFWMSAICLAWFDPWSWRHHDQEPLAWHSITSQYNLNPKPLSCENPKSYSCMVSSYHTICPVTRSRASSWNT